MPLGGPEGTGPGAVPETAHARGVEPPTRCLWSGGPRHQRGQRVRGASGLLPAQPEPPQPHPLGQSLGGWRGQTRAASWLPDHRQPWRPVVLPPLWPHTEGPAHLSWSLGTTKPRQNWDRSRQSRTVCRDGVGPALLRQLCEPLPCIQLSHRRQQASLKKWNRWRRERKET